MIFKPNWKTGKGVDSYTKSISTASQRYSFESRKEACSSPMAILVANTSATATVRVDLGDGTVVAKNSSIYLGPGKEKVLVVSRNMTNIAFLSDGDSSVTYTLGSLVA